MRVEKITPEKLEQHQDGASMLLYGETGVGKTLTALLTAPGPVLWIYTEPRDAKRISRLAFSLKPDLELSQAYYKNWDEFMAFFANAGNFEDFRTIIIDSLTMLMNIQLGFEVDQENYEARTDNKKEDKHLTSQAKRTQEGYGVLSSQMLRFTNLCDRLTQDGKVIIMLCLLAQNPKFDRSLAGAPLLAGREYPNNLPGFLDFIGYVEPRCDRASGEVIYPPLVSFESGDGSFMCKWSGFRPSGPMQGRVLNITRILDVSNGAGNGNGNGKKKGGEEEEVEAD